MAVAGNSYANVPVVVRGSLEDPADFGSRTTVLVVTSQPAAAQAAVPPVTVLRGTLQDPPVLTTPAPAVVAAPNDSRWYRPGPVMVLGAPQAPQAAPAAAAPAPVVVAAQPPWPRTAQAITGRGTLQDPPVLTTAAPVVVSSQPPWPKTVQAVTVRNTLADPPAPAAAAPVVVAAPGDRRWYGTSPVLVLGAPQPAAPVPGPAPGPVVVTGPPDRRWFSASPVLVLSGGTAPPPPPASVSRMLLAAYV